jgi:hypothetical protein
MCNRTNSSKETKRESINGREEEKKRNGTNKYGHHKNIYIPCFHRSNALKMGLRSFDINKKQRSVFERSEMKTAASEGLKWFVIETVGSSVFNDGRKKT